MSSDDEEDYGSDVDDEEEVTRNVKTNVKRKPSTSTVKNANKKAKMSFIDDAAELSGSDIDSEDDEEEGKKLKKKTVGNECFRQSYH